MKIRRMAALLGAVALTFSATSVAFATAPVGHEVTICHANSDEKSPYVIETPDISQAGYSDDLAGHAGHENDGVWYPGAKDDGFNWGDIIPPYDYQPDEGPLFHYDGLNWTAEGQAIYKNDCVIEPDIHVEKSASVANLPVGGGEVTYSYAVTNTGNVPLTNVTVSDNKCSPVGYVGGDENSNSKLDLTETWTFSCTTTITVTTTNTATATGHAGDTEVSDTDDAIVTVTPHAPAINVDKTASKADLPAGGGSVTYTYAVTNTGNVPLSNVTVTDNKCAPVGYVSGDTNTNSKLDLTETWTFSCTTTITATTINTALATGHDGDTAVTDTDDATVTVAAPPPDAPAINVDKTASVATLPVGGGSVTYTYAVTNTGNVPLSTVTVTDNKCAPVGYVSGDTNTNSMLDLTETWTFSCTTTITATTTNTAVATGHVGETEVSDTDDATVTVTPPGGGVAGETNVPTAPATDTLNSGATGDAGGTLPILLLILGAIGLGAVVLTPKRGRR